MFKAGKFMAAAAAASLAVAPAMAAPVSTVSAGKSVRASSNQAHQNEALGGGLLIAVIAAVAVIVGVVIIATDKNSTSP